MLPDGNEAKLFTLGNNHGITIKITNYGATITSIETPDKQGKLGNIVCGFEDLEDYISENYLASCPYFGSAIGRCANRIAKGELVVDGKKYQLAINNGPNHLHGGLIGFDKKLWDARLFETKNSVGVELTLFSPHLEENYPGNLQVTCTYTLNNKNELSIEYEAITDKTTVVNLTNHSYFNLTGGKEGILNHELQLAATHMTEMHGQIPTGKIIPVKGTPYDFTAQKKIKADIGFFAHRL